MSNAENFYHAFVQQMDCAIALYKRGGGAFTEYVIGLIQNIIENEFQYHSEKEYFRIDVIGWVDRKRELMAQAELLGLNPHLWDLKIAVEHENDSKDWTDELIKLAHIRCPLKVIIGYTPCDCRDDLEYARLRAAAGWLAQVAAFEPEAEEEYLLILGNASAQNKLETYTEFDYRGYLLDYDSRCFMRIN